MANADMAAPDWQRRVAIAESAKLTLYDFKTIIFPLTVKVAKCKAREWGFDYKSFGFKGARDYVQQGFFPSDNPISHDPFNPTVLASRLVNNPDALNHLLSVRHLLETKIHKELLTPDAARYVMTCYDNIEGGSPPPLLVNGKAFPIDVVETNFCHALEYEVVSAILGFMQHGRIQDIKP